MNAFMVAVLAVAVTLSVAQATKTSYENPKACHSAELIRETPEPDTTVEGCTCSGSSDSYCAMHPSGCTCSASPEQHCSMHTLGCACSGTLQSHCTCTGSLQSHCSCNTRPHPHSSSSLPPCRQRLCCSGPATTPSPDASQAMIQHPEMATSRCHCSDPNPCPGHGPAPFASLVPAAHSATRPCPCSPPCQFCARSVDVSGPADVDSDQLSEMPKLVSVVLKPVSCNNRPPTPYRPRLWSAATSGSSPPFAFYNN